MASQIIPFNSLQRRIAPLRDLLREAADAVIADGEFVLGRRVAEFETRFAAYCGTGHCIGVGNGTDALELALKAVGVGPGDRVILAANAAMYGATAVAACGAVPLYADILPHEATLNPASVAQALRTAPDARAILVTHLYGRLARMEPLLALAAAHGVAVVEDCAQAHGAQARDGRRAGAFGAAAAFSFYPTKNLGALGDGGAVVCADADIAERARRLRQYGWSGKYENTLSGGRNSRLDEIQAAMLNVMLPRLDGWNARRRAIAMAYAEGIRNPAIETPPPAGKDDVAHLYVVRSDRRQALRVHLDAAGVHTAVHYPQPDHRQPCHGGRYAGLALPETERDAERVLSLPCFPEMTDDEVSGVIRACNRFR